MMEIPMFGNGVWNSMFHGLYYHRGVWRMGFGRAEERRRVLEYDTPTDVVQYIECWNIKNVRLRCGK